MSAIGGTGKSVSPKSSKTRGPYTARGQSCTNCRKRKIKCDGNKPECSQCMRSDSRAACEYRDTASSESEVQALEANIKILQAKIRELEAAQEVGVNEVKLHQPYASLPPQDPADDSGGEVRVGVYMDALDWTRLPQGDEHDIMFQPLLEIFLRYTRELGFFLNVQRFRESLLLPTGAPGRPSEGLLSSISLLGFHLSGLSAAEPEEREHGYLSRALTHVANTLSSTHPDRILQTLQAEILLSMYFFRSARLLEGKYHLHAALSIAFAARLHKLRSPRTDLTVLPMTSSSILETITQLDAPSDQVAEGERINGFWTIFATSNCWAAAADIPQDIMLESLGSTVDTPWPLDMPLYEQGFFSSGVVGQDTVSRFLNQEPPSPSPGDASWMAMYVKSSILIVRAATLAAAYRPDAANAFAAQVATLDGLLTSFKSNLPSFNDVGPSSEGFLFLYAAHLISNVACITLNRRFKDSFIDSAQKVLSAAEDSVNLLSEQADLASAHVNPIFAPLWMNVGQVLIQEFGRLRAQYPQWTSGEREKDLIEKIHRVFAYLRNVPVKSPLNDYMLSKLEEIYQGILG
ncbi:hypothetical protein GYMLUDRAFT_257723 [Collybiopsis luxurians FD-317 M1]|nr:hypothetical protein GYMLUDRAFT_257723 [Collybiopsis luxurians FD-317 M1]